jgi:hypothetical protein
MNGIGSDIVQSITRNIEPAYIVVHDYRAADAGAASAAADPAAYAAIPTADRAGALAGSSASKDKMFRVQYNPAELRLNAYVETGAVRDLRAGGGANSVNAQAPRPGRIDLSANLWFDKMSPATSFMLDKNIAPTSASGATNIVKSFMKEETVRDEVEGFIAVMRNPFTQRITFYWSEFAFSGVISALTATYTMFSASGLPVRAKVFMRIRQRQDEASMARWYKDIEKAFGGDQSNLVRTEQTVSNILNIGL